VTATHHSHVCGHCRHCRSGHETSCAERRFLGDAGLNGGYAELVSIGAENVLHLPGSIGFEAGAIVGCAIGTELNAIHDVARVAPGERVLVTGAGGGLGLHGVQLARLAGAFTIGLTTSRSKVERIRAAGADAVVVIRPGEDFSPEVRALTGGEGVDVAIDNVGSAVFHATRRSLATCGRFVLVGQLVGDFVSFNPAQLFLRNISLLSAKGASRAQLATALALVAERRITPMIAEVLPLAAAAEAHRLVEAGRSAGRVVLSPALG
jgi:D-arabinose 1-dehydrogenase-like Zn-dependent alcohol dehydrogenase